MPRLDARAKASGQTRYIADLGMTDLLHAVVVRSTAAHGEIDRIDLKSAREAPGVVGIFTGADVADRTFGRSVCDVPILARDKVRFIGEPVAAVVARSREAAERAAALVEVEYRELPVVTTIEEALAEKAPAIHATPWDYPHAAVSPNAPRNVQAAGDHGRKDEVDRALAGASYVVEATYRTPAVHQGYLEPWGFIADAGASSVRLWGTNKASHLLRTQLGELFDLDRSSIEVEPIPVGGDFGGKGSPGYAPLCIELSRLTGHPVRLILRYHEELTTTNPRHGSVTTMRLGCDEAGNLVAGSADSILDGGAYAGYNPTPGPLHGSLDPSGYRMPHYYATSRVVYTNTVPKGNMRAPGSPQCVFAFESALDELAKAAGISPFEIRRRNLLRDGEATAYGSRWREFRGVETLEATTLEPIEAPAGWLVGEGWSIYAKTTKTEATMSLRLSERPGGGIRVEVPVTDTGTGSFTVMRDLLAKRLGYSIDEVEVVQVPTSELPRGLNAGGSRVTSTMSMATDVVAKAWSDRNTGEPLTLDINKPPDEQPVGSYLVQRARVAVDPETGEVAVLSIASGVDVAEIVNSKAHQMQIDGGTAMGFGFACLEDLDEREGQVWAANLGEFKIPSMRDLPRLETTLVRGGLGVGEANVKNIGELTTPPTAAAIANAVYAATGRRIRELPITAERVYRALHNEPATTG